MARKKAQKEKAETTLVPHRTPDLSSLLQRAQTGDSAITVKAFLDAGGVAGALVPGGGPSGMQPIPLLHHKALYNSHPHAELAESVTLLVAAGVDINCLSSDVSRIPLMFASDKSCCTRVLQVFLQSSADVLASTSSSVTTLHHAAVSGRTASCELLLARERSLIHARDERGCIALIGAVDHAFIDVVRVLCQQT
jgi:ankyrin repeat protein